MCDKNLEFCCKHDKKEEFRFHRIVIIKNQLKIYFADKKFNEINYKNS